MAMKNVMLIEMSAENEDDFSKQYVADIYLPASIYEIDDAVEKCRGYLVKTDMMPLNISECDSVPLLSQLRFDTVTIYELNCQAIFLWLPVCIAKTGEASLPLHILTPTPIF